MDFKSLISYELYIDGVLLVLSLTSFILCIVVLEIAVLFNANQNWENPPLDKQYFTLNTYYFTTNCNHHSPVTFIVVSVWFLFFSMICTGYSVIRSPRKVPSKPIEQTSDNAAISNVPITRGTKDQAVGMIMVIKQMVMILIAVMMMMIMMMLLLLLLLLMMMIMMIMMMMITMIQSRQY